jgi:hypothetical protein
MREKIILVPRAGYIVRDPETKKPLPAEGMEVERSSYWVRRIQAGDVSVVVVPKPRPARVKTKKEG